MQQFNKDELNMILKFGAEDLFKEEAEVEQEKEVDLDAILERAEMREEEEEVPQSEANKELLAAFKCTTLTFEETEKDIELEGTYKWKSVFWIRIQELCGSGSVFRVRIWIHTCKNRIK